MPQVAPVAPQGASQVAPSSGSASGSASVARKLPPLNPLQARNTDPALGVRASGEVEHNYDADGPAPGRLWFRWAHGSIVAAKNQDPRVQAMRYNEDTIALRENICVDWRGPFTYLLFGNRGALLIDTGATANPEWYPLRTTVDALMAQWQGNRHKPALPLTIGFTSAENAAQNGGREQFAQRTGTTIAPREPHAMQSFYGLEKMEGGGTGTLDLGGRIIDVLPTPGTHRDGLSFYDRYTQILFTGDLLFPGKIRIAHERDLVASLQRLQQWKAQHPVHCVMGGHIDMQFLPGKAYNRFATFKPYERELPLSPETIDEALACAEEIRGKRTVLARTAFLMSNGVGPDEEPDALPAGMPDLHGPRPV